MFGLIHEWVHLATVLDVADKVVARAASPAGSGGVSPRESNPTMRPRSGTLRKPAAEDGCATPTESRYALHECKVWTNLAGYLNCK